MVPTLPPVYPSKCVPSSVFYATSLLTCAMSTHRLKLPAPNGQELQPYTRKLRQGQVIVGCYFSPHVAPRSLSSPSALTTGSHVRIDSSFVYCPLFSISFAQQVRTLLFLTSPYRASTLLNQNSFSTSPFHYFIDLSPTAAWTLYSLSSVTYLVFFSLHIHIRVRRFSSFDLVL